MATVEPGGGDFERSLAISQVGVWIVSPDRELKSRLEAKRQRLLEEEAGWGFDPARNDADFEQLMRLASSK